MTVDWNIEEGYHEFDKGYGTDTVSIHPDGSNLNIYGNFTSAEMEATYLKMIELHNQTQNQ